MLTTYMLSGDLEVSLETGFERAVLEFFQSLKKELICGGLDNITNLCREFSMKILHYGLPFCDIAKMLMASYIKVTTREPSVDIINAMAETDVLMMSVSKPYYAFDSLLWKFAEAM